MSSETYDVNKIKESISSKILRYNGISVNEAKPQQIYHAVASTVRDQIMQEWLKTKKEFKEHKGKKLYYLSVEFLMGRSLHCNLINMLSEKNYEQALKELNISLNDILPMEPDPALGNGGLGRLAAGFLDSLSSLKLPAMGSTIRYEYGLFKQKIVDGQQVELPDMWLNNGNVWEIPATEDTCTVYFGGQVVEEERNGKMYFRLKDAYAIDAVPYDMPIVGYNNEFVNNLRTWSAKSRERIDLEHFGEGEYLKAVEEMQMAEVISKVLYPEDKHYEGKMLRLKQHYFFTSATLQYAIKVFKKQHGKNFALLPEKAVFHINDTHPGLVIPELMRILIDEEDLSWEEAQDITYRSVAYTNHTVMEEALECWSTDLMKQTLPRIFMILEELNKRVCEKLFQYYPNQWDKIAHMAIISYGQVHMANLCVALSFSVNGVSQLHGKILKDTLFHDYYLIDNQKFSAITNGITHRRWLLSSNPDLTNLIEETIGSNFKTDPNELKKLLPYADDAAFRDEFAKIKQKNKERLQTFIKERQNIDVDTSFIFDAQAKRLHEYKRQLLNALHIHVLYNRIISDSSFTMPPRLFLFGAKAAPGYWKAKLIIRYINQLAECIKNHPRASQMLQVVFLENYDVTTAETLMPAAEISQQLSTAGKEASGTGNMKFMMNGAITLGTMDGANVEIFEQVGADNIYIFGMRANTVEGLYRERSYKPMDIVENNFEIRTALNQWVDGTLFPNEWHVLNELYQTLLSSEHGHTPDAYFVLKDFGSYAMANNRIMADYEDKEKWLKMSITNTACSGFFSSDRTIAEYNEKIWKLK